MIQFSEGFWMEAFIIALIGAAGALIAAIVSGIYSNRKINKELALHDQKSTSGHESLSKEHQGLAKDAETLTKKLDMQFSNVSHNVHELSSEVRIIRERQVEERAKQEFRYSNLSEAQKHLVQSAGDVGKFVQEFGRLAAENQQLRQENMQLQQNLQNLKIALEKLQRAPHQQRNQPEAYNPSLRNDGLEPDL